MKIEEIRSVLRRMQPGQEFCFPAYCFRLVEYGFRENIYRFDPRDWILEGIVGSAYEYGYREDLFNGDTIYFRLAEPLTDGRRTYVSPDRRDRFDKDFRGFYSLKKKEPDDERN